MPTILLSFVEFCEQQQCAHVTSRGRILFENGSQSDGQFNHVEPPSDPVELLRLRHEYAKVHVENLVKQYNNDRSAIGTQVEFHRLGAGPMPESGWQEHLKRLASQIELAIAKRDELAGQLPRRTGNDLRANAYSERQQEAMAAVRTLSQFPNF